MLPTPPAALPPPTHAPTHTHTHLQVIARANDTNYGLASGVFGRDITAINRITRGLKAGTVWVNCFNVSDWVGHPLTGLTGRS
jgi:acyl-CoA reductase-like NAD-dependent aldehyde dehydrogenase